FAGAGESGCLTATTSGPAFGRMDLLTVVMHELGHTFGLEDLPAARDAHDLMATNLVPGERRLPGHPSRSVTPDATGTLVASASAFEDSPGDLIATELVFAFAEPGHVASAGAPAGVVSGAPGKGHLPQAPALPESSLLDPALSAFVAGMRWDRQPGHADRRQDRRESPEPA